MRNKKDTVVEGEIATKYLGFLGSANAQYSGV